jgi:quercetin dioxygenase-like cupin family protein
MRSLSRKQLVLLLGVVLPVLAGVGAGAVHALTATTQARGTITLHEDKVQLTRGIAKLIGESTDAAVQQIVLGPGEGPNWHTHAGPALVIIKSGRFTLVADDCTEQTFGANEVFVDQGFGHVHRAYNPGPGTTEVWVTYVIPQGAGLIIPTTAPECAS